MFLSAGGVFEGQFNLDGGHCEALDGTWELLGRQKMELLESEKASPEGFVRKVNCCPGPPLTLHPPPLNCQRPRLLTRPSIRTLPVCLGVRQNLTVLFLFFLSHSDKDGVCRAV